MFFVYGIHPIISYRIRKINQAFFYMWVIKFSPLRWNEPVDDWLMREACPLLLLPMLLLLDACDDMVLLEILWGLTKERWSCNWLIMERFCLYLENKCGCMMEVEEILLVAGELPCPNTTPFPWLLLILSWLPIIGLWIWMGACVICWNWENLGGSGCM